jgi:hypothetical protein
VANPIQVRLKGVRAREELFVRKQDVLLVLVRRLL